MELRADAAGEPRGLQAHNAEQKGFKLLKKLAEVKP